MVIISLKVTEGQILGGPTISFVLYVILSMCTKFFMLLSQKAQFLCYSTLLFVLTLWERVGQLEEWEG